MKCVFVQEYMYIYMYTCKHVYAYILLFVVHVNTRTYNTTSSLSTPVHVFAFCGWVSRAYLTHYINSADRRNPLLGGSCFAMPSTSTATSLGKLRFASKVMDIATHAVASMRFSCGVTNLKIRRSSYLFDSVPALIPLNTVASSAPLPEEVKVVAIGSAACFFHNPRTRLLPGRRVSELLGEQSWLKKTGSFYKYRETVGNWAVGVWKHTEIWLRAPIDASPRTIFKRSKMNSCHNWCAQLGKLL